MTLLPAMTTKVRLSLIATAAFALLATGAMAVDEAGAAGSGGVGSTPSSDSGGGDSSNEGVSAKYDRLWDRTSAGARRWARRTSECESGGDPDAIGGSGLYRGAFQFMRSTWKSSPQSPGGDPIAYPYRTQAVVAVALKKRDGADHWPGCG